MTEHHLTIFADYFQFYLLDAEAEFLDVEDAWKNPLTLERLLAFDPKNRAGFVVSTARNMEVPVHIIVSDSAPKDENFDTWQQVNECSIEIPSGKFIVAGMTDYPPDATHISVEAGSYRARIYYANLDKLSENGLEGEDHYRIHLWPASFANTVVLKQKKLTASR